jgi:hypothetical protein
MMAALSEHVGAMLSRPADRVDLHRRRAPMPVPDGGPGDLLELQRTAGNRAVTTMVAREKEGVATPGGGEGFSSAWARRVREAQEARDRRDPLSKALGFDSKFYNPSAWADRLRHPMTQTLIRLMRAALIAKEVKKDDKKAVAIGRVAYQMLGSLENVIAQLGRTAPSTMGWHGESMVLGMLVQDLKGATWRAMFGGWGNGTESLAIRYLSLLDVGIARVIAPAMTRSHSGARRPGGTVERKVYLGTVVTPVLVANWYLKVSVTLPEKNEGGKPGSGGSGKLEFDEDGKPKGSLEVKGGNDDAQVTGSVSGGKGGDLEPTVYVGGKQGSIEASKEGIKAEVIAKKKDWTEKVEASKDGITYSSTHAAGGGLKISGKLDRMTLSAASPEIDIAGASIQFNLITELTPIPGVFRRTQTQTPEAVRAFEKACLAMLVITGLPVAAAGGAAALPVLVGVGEAIAGWELATGAGAAAMGMAR